MKDKALIEAVSQADDRLIVLSTGVVLKGRKVNPLVLTRIMGKNSRPKPPKEFIEVMGREMENPDNPDYIDAVRQWKVESADSLARALILLGTSLESLPKGFPGPEDREWLNEYTLLGFDVVDDPQWRYLNWVQFKATMDEDDVRKIITVVGRLSGVREADVKSAETFSGGNAK